MGNLLAGKKGIISGALNSESIAWKVAERCVEEGAQIVLTNAPVAMRMGEINGLAEKCNAPVIGADATSIEDLEQLFTRSMEHFGGKFDFVLHSIGMSVNVRKGKAYTDLNYDWMQKNLRCERHFLPQDDADHVEARRYQRLGQRGGSFLHRRSACIPRLLRNG